MRIWIAAIILFLPPFCRTGACARISGFDDMDGTVWCAFRASGDPGIILYFAGGYYAEMFDSLKGGFLPPSEKVEYEAVKTEGGMLVRSLCSPKLPPFEVADGGKRLKIAWPIGEAAGAFERISVKEADRLLKNFSISDIDFRRLKTRGGSAK